MIFFRAKVYETIKKIPQGKTMTYGQVARTIGNPKAARAVGNALAKNRNSRIPCHRVIRSDGKIGGYKDGIRKKRELLVKEGIVL